MYDSVLGKASFLLHTEYFAVGEKPLRISQIGNPLRSNYCVLARIVCIYPKLGFAILLFKNSHMLVKHSSNTVTVRSVVIMVVCRSGDMAANREAQRKATHMKVLQIQY